MSAASGAEEEVERDEVLKILVIGDHDVGKTSIIKRLGKLHRYSREVLPDV